MKTSEYLSACKARLKITSDYALAKRLRIPSSLMSKYASGKVVPGPVVAFRIAEILGDQPVAVVADFEAERAEKMGKDDEVEEWAGIVRKIGSGAMSVLLALFAMLGMLTPPPADASVQQRTTGVMSTSLSSVDPLSIVSS